MLVKIDGREALLRSVELFLSSATGTVPGCRYFGSYPAALAAVGIDHAALTRHRAERG
jgi:hypothetical protein